VQLHTPAKDHRFTERYPSAPPQKDSLPSVLRKTPACYLPHHCHFEDLAAERNPCLPRSVARLVFRAV
jgi:hypothetical protein